MKYHIALDSGGTKTESILFDSTGRVLARDCRDGANPLDIGFETAYGRYIGAVDALLARLPQGERVASLFGCVAGCKAFPQIREGIQTRIGGAPCELGNDSLGILSAMIGKEDGVSLISGTGSSCQYRKDGRIVHSIGGYGYLLDTGGSGYDLGRAAIVAALRAQDGRGEQSLLTQMVEKKMGGTVRADMPAVYQKGRPYIASFAPLVFEAYRQGDPQAKRIFDQNTDYYGEALHAMRRHIGHGFTAVLGGSVFQNVPEYAAAVGKKAPEDCAIIPLDKPVIYGAALQAVWLCGVETGEKFEQNFIRTYSKL